MKKNNKKKKEKEEREKKTKPSQGTCSHSVSRLFDL